MRYPSATGEKIPYFSIKGDRQTKQVRFLYNTINDIFFDVIHEVTVNNRTQTIQCLNADGSNPNGCPLCQQGFDQIVKLYIPVLDLSDNTVKIWTRSKNFVAQLQGLAARNNPISGVVIEVMRIGAQRDPKTQYVLQPITMNDGKTVEQLGVKIPDSSSLMRVMDYNQMQNYALTIGGNVGSTMPVSTPNFGGYNNQQPQFAQPQQNFAPQNNFGAPQPMQQQQFSAAPPVQPNYAPAPTNQFIGSEPVRRTPAAPSVPNYSVPQDMATTPMQGIPTPSPAPVPQPTAQTAQPGSYIDNDDDLPF